MFCKIKQVHGNSILIHYVMQGEILVYIRYGNNKIGNIFYYLLPYYHIILFLLFYSSS